MKYLFLFLALALTLASCKVNKELKYYDSKEDVFKRLAYANLMKKCIEKYVGKDTMDFSIPYHREVSMSFVYSKALLAIYAKIDSLTDKQLAIIDDYRNYSNVSEIAIGKTAYIDLCLDFYKSRELDSLCTKWLKDAKKAEKQNIFWTKKINILPLKRNYNIDKERIYCDIENRSKDTILYLVGLDIFKDGEMIGNSDDVYYLIPSKVTKINSFSRIKPKSTLTSKTGSDYISKESLFGIKRILKTDHIKEYEDYEFRFRVVYKNTRDSTKRYIYSDTFKIK